MKSLKRFEDWFNLKFGWFFVNGRKQVERQNKWLKDKSQLQNTDKKKAPLKDISKGRLAIAD